MEVLCANLCPACVYYCERTGESALALVPIPSEGIVFDSSLELIRESALALLPIPLHGIMFDSSFELFEKNATEVNATSETDVLGILEKGSSRTAATWAQVQKIKMATEERKKRETEEREKRAAKAEAAKAEAAKAEAAKAEAAEAEAAKAEAADEAVDAKPAEAVEAAADEAAKSEAALVTHDGKTVNRKRRRSEVERMRPFAWDKQNKIYPPGEAFASSVESPTRRANARRMSGGGRFAACTATSA